MPYKWPLPYTIHALHITLYLTHDQYLPDGPLLTLDLSLDVVGTDRAGYTLAPAGWRRSPCE